MPLCLSESMSVRLEGPGVSATADSVSDSSREAGPGTRPRRPWSSFARAALITVAMLILGLTAAGLVAGLRDWTLIGSRSINEAITAAGISVTAVTLVGLVLPHAAFAAIGIVIFLRRGDDWPALLFALGLVVLTTFRPLIALERAVPTLAVPIELVWIFETYLLLITLFVFPDGRFVPSVTRVLALAALPAAWFLSTPIRSIIMLPDQPPDAIRAQFETAVVVVSVFIAAGLSAQVYRYRTAPDPVQRQQIKLVGLAVGMLLVVMTTVIAVPSLFVDTSNHWFAWAMLATVPAFILVAVSVAVAILRYNLFAIDRIVSRTVAYAALSVVLAAVYATTAVVSGQLLGGQSDLSVAAATLAAAFTFHVARRRVQDAVDKRFNRRKYDIARTAIHFGRRLKDELDVDELEQQLLDVVRTTLEPRTASLWHTPAMRAHDRTS